MFKALREISINDLYLDVLRNSDPVDCFVRQEPGAIISDLIRFVSYSVVRSSVGWKPEVAEVLNLLLNLIDWALSILSVKLTSCASCVSCVLSVSCVSCILGVLCMSCVAGRAPKSDDSCDIAKPPAVHWFEDKSSKSAIVHCISIASDACDALRSLLLLPMWPNSLCVRMEVNVIDDWADISLELTTTWAFRRAVP